MKNTVGRPRKANPKSKRFAMRLTEADYNRLMEYADRQNETATEFITKLLHNTLFDDTTTDLHAQTGVGMGA